MNTVQLIRAVAIHADVPEAAVVRVVEALHVLLPPVPLRHDRDLTPYELHRQVGSHEGVHEHTFDTTSTSGTHVNAHPRLLPASP